jgi:hypothetical protein
MRRLGLLTLTALAACSPSEADETGPTGPTTVPSDPTNITSATEISSATDPTEATPTTSATEPDTTGGPECAGDGDCSQGNICVDGACVPGCSDLQPCADGSCCAAACVDVLADPAHCGGCDPCPVADNALAACAEGVCGFGGCVDGFKDCDGDQGNGCEVEGDCQCEPGSQIACYTAGPEETKDVGACKSGLQTCNAEGTGYGACEGEVGPAAAEVCGNTIDDNCDGQVDEDPDADGDGWTACGGDCCDSVGPTCLSPELVNPGAFDVEGNRLDDNCDGMLDNVVPACDGGLASNSADPLEYAKAIDLCQFTTEDAPPEERIWGVISGAFNRSNGAGAPNANARAIRPGFGPNIAPKANMSLAVLSTGHAADQNDNNPGFSQFQGGTDLNTDAPVPSDWLMLNNNNFPNVQGCPEPQGGATGQDTIQLKLRVRVPTNALSFSTKIYFFSSEYPEWVCSPYNDFFVTLVDSMGAGNPNDKNVAIYKNAQDQLFPVGVNLVKTAEGLFTQCKNGPIGCGGGAVPGNYNGCLDNLELNGTGFHLTNPQPQFPGDPGYCTTNNQVGGGTGWLKMSGNVQPGEIMELRFVIWDTGDPWYDSLVLLDDFQWSVTASEPGVEPG